MTIDNNNIDWQMWKGKTISIHFPQIFLVQWTDLWTWFLVFRKKIHLSCSSTNWYHQFKLGSNVICTVYKLVHFWKKPFLCYDCHENSIYIKIWYWGEYTCTTQIIRKIIKGATINRHSYHHIHKWCHQNTVYEDENNLNWAILLSSLSNEVPYKWRGMLPHMFIG